MKLLMISGDRNLIYGQKGPFYYFLKEFSRYWERIDIICPKAATEDQELEFFNNVYLHGTINSSKSIFKQAKKIYQNSAFQIVVSHDYPPFRHSQAAQKIQRVCQVPYFLEVHHIVGYPKAADFKEWLLKIYFQLFFKKAARFAKAIRVVNQMQVPSFLEKLNIPKEKIIYLPSYYIDRDIYFPQNLNKKYDLLFVGRLVKNKGIDLLIKVLLKLKKDLPNFKMAIIGEGHLKKDLEFKINQSIIKENVELLGWLPDNEALATAYNQAKILLVTSYNEGGPRVGLEAMACGTPVISTKVGVNVDLIKNGENGYLVNWSANDFVNKIKIILNDQKISQKISQQGIKVVQNFDYHQMIENYTQALQKLV
ncbi:glycosyltransferase [Patescibacteria group bacterium]|nr:glycosyltransferase [Patescibacteria group bacterium]